jgi:hypothetical protein
VAPRSSQAFDLFPPNLDRIESCLLAAMELVPALGEVGLRSIVNGPTIWTGDSLARCGRTRVPGYCVPHAAHRPHPTHPFHRSRPPGHRAARAQ